MIIVLNFKTYLKSTNDHLKLAEKLKKLRKKNLWLALNPYFYLPLAKPLKKMGFKVGIQNIAPLLSKPQTGETIFNFELINYADFVLIGHSERYRVGENKKIILEKIKTLQDENLKFLIFFSENSNRAKTKFSQVKKQTEENLKNFLSVIKKSNYKKIYFVYEPWWAISTEMGKPPTKEFLKDFLDWYRKQVKIPILYGGSYNSKLAVLYKDLKFDGYVLGKTSTDIKEVKLILG